MSQPELASRAREPLCGGRWRAIWRAHPPEVPSKPPPYPNMGKTPAAPTGTFLRLSLFSLQSFYLGAHRLQLSPTRLQLTLEGEIALPKGADGPLLPLDTCLDALSLLLVKLLNTPFAMATRVGTTKSARASATAIFAPRSAAAPTALTSRDNLVVPISVAWRSHAPQGASDPSTRESELASPPFTGEVGKEASSKPGSGVRVAPM